MALLLLRSIDPSLAIRTCPRKTKHLAYTTLVRPILEYASIIWGPQITSNIHKPVTVQRRSARHIMHNYNRYASVTTMLQHLHLPTLQQRPPALQIIILYRITHQLTSIPTTSHHPLGILNTTSCPMPAHMYSKHLSSLAPSTYGTTYNLS